MKEERKWGSYLSIIISKVKEIIKSTLLKMSTDLPLVRSTASVKCESKAWEACPKSISSFSPSESQRQGVDIVK